MSKILIKNGKVWDGEKFFFADVLTNGAFISEIAKNISDEADFVFDAFGKTVTPGLVDLHAHIKGLSKQYGTDPSIACFPFGVTVANDAGSDIGNQAYLDTLSVKTTVFVSVNIVNNRAELSRIDELLKIYGPCAIGLKTYFDTEVTAVSDIRPLKDICDFAKARNLKVMVHCSNSPAAMAQIVHTLSSGDILTHIYHGKNNPCTDNDFEAFRLAKEKGVILDTGFAGYVHTDFKILKTAINAGYIPDTISTDITRMSAYKRGGRYGMTMCMNIAKNVGMKEADIFKAVTSSPAKALGRENLCGCLKVGRTADIAVFNFTDEGFDLTDKENYRLKSNIGYRCVLTVSNGEIVYKD